MTTEWSFDAPRRDRLRAAYEQARTDGLDVFVFDDKELYTPYARYLLEYLDMELGT